eukprot:TRINITY_DN10896_c0_g1_i1.p1 TRINITY_DN10896_c0_g1~~TRINITY_DN10896_c0_g1_i1.p1  ORF type:complete len:285 (-),score=110.68 TRINITY_DN10896_c0_g1_i1:62-916(-)
MGHFLSVYFFSRSPRRPGAMPPKRCLRKRALEDDEPVDVEEERREEAQLGSFIRTKMESTRKEQRRRFLKLREAGVPRAKVEEEVEEEKWGLQEKPSTMQDFTEGSGNLLGSTIEHEDKMLEYIEARMKERHPVAPDDSNDDEAAGKSSIDVEALKDPTQKLDLQLYTEPIEDANRWLIGIQEVQLPIEYKVRNIEDTEQARKRELLETQRKATKKAESSRPVVAHHRRFGTAQTRGIAQVAESAVVTSNLGQAAPGTTTRAPSGNVAGDQALGDFVRTLEEQR